MNGISSHSSGGRFLGWHINLRLFKSLKFFSRQSFGDISIFLVFHITFAKKGSIMCMHGRRNWIIEFQILKRLKIDFTQFNWQTDSLIEIDNVVNGEKIDLRKKNAGNEIFMQFCWCGGACRGWTDVISLHDEISLENYFPNLDDEKFFDI